MADSYLLSHSSQILAYLTLFFFSYKIIIYIQRLFFHPLTNFPGPKLCAASRLYEFYWDSYQHGRFWTKLPGLHQRYGPIVRIAPDELHIRDPEYFNYLFSFKPLDKWAITAKEFGLDYAMFGTEKYKQYTHRRAAYGDAFSRTKTLKLQPLVVEKIEKACDQMRSNIEKNSLTDLAYMFRAITAEVMTQYMYGQQYGFFEDEATTKGLYNRRFDSLFGLTHLGRFIPPIIPMILIFLRSQIRQIFKIQESATSLMGFMKFAEKMLKGLVEEHGIKEDPLADRDFKTAAEVYLHSSLPIEDKVGQALVQATMAPWSGGWDTTAFALTQASYYILRNPPAMKKLQEELKKAWRYPDEEPSIRALDDLEYLNAILKESLRLMHGVLTRLTRINPTAPEQYKGWTIPPGTKISMSLPDIHLDENIWGEDVEQFRPERWIGHPELEKWLVVFSRGTRVCAGEELAWMELKLIIATLFRRFELEIPEEENVTDDDVVPYSDGHTPGPKKDLQRVPVLAKVLSS